MSNVYFISETDKENFKDAFRRETEKAFQDAKLIGIKLHMGEPGNKNFIRPDFVKIVVDILKQLNKECFLFDSPVSYPGPRHTEEGYKKAAEKHGFIKDNIGCETIISNEAIKLDGKKLSYGVCKSLVEADAVLVLSHVKGHPCCGFGAAIKNLGMGALTKESKSDIHEGGKPELAGKCIKCGKCEKACPTDNIRYDSDGPVFDKSYCIGCSDCVYACENGALSPRGEYFDRLLSDGAGCALKSYKKTLFVNVLERISKMCDCVADAGRIVSDDIGVLISDNIVAIDKASLDLINRKHGSDLFLEVHKKSPLVHISEMSKLGFGGLKYELIG